MPPPLVEHYCRLSPESARDLEGRVRGAGLSNRALQGVLKVARTIADLSGRDGILAEDLEEALEFRRSGEDPYDILSLSNQVSVPGIPPHVGCINGFASRGIPEPVFFSHGPVIIASCGDHHSEAFPQRFQSFTLCYPCHRMPGFEACDTLFMEFFDKIR